MIISEWTHAIGNGERPLLTRGAGEPAMPSPGGSLAADEARAILLHYRDDLMVWAAELAAWLRHQGAAVRSWTLLSADELARTWQPEASSFVAGRMAVLLPEQEQEAMVQLRIDKATGELALQGESLTFPARF
jgi:hypothetical protein